DLGRSYEAVIRVNSQSGKGGMAYLLRTEHGLDLPRRLQIEFSAIVQEKTDADGGEVSPEALWDAFTDEYLPSQDEQRRWGHYGFRDVRQESTGDGADRITVTLVVDGEEHEVTGIGNGPLDGFVKALAERQIDVRILDYAEHALTEGDDSLAASYIECEIGDRIFWGVGIDGSITRASLEAITSALNSAPSARHRARGLGPAPARHGVRDAGHRHSSPRGDQPCEASSLRARSACSEVCALSEAHSCASVSIGISPVTVWWVGVGRSQPGSSS